MHTKRYLEAVAAISAAGILISGEATYLQFEHSTVDYTTGTLLKLPLPLFDLVAFMLIFGFAARALWRRVSHQTIP
jgi:hypothetical protein